VSILDALMEIVSTVPPEPQSNQRFGNLAFRTYYKVVQEVSARGGCRLRRGDKEMSRARRAADRVE
jgi:hypothetical protein